MRLSRAILVMLLLHIVAVGGIFAFSYIKERDSKRDSANPSTVAVEAEDSHLAAKPAATDALRGKTDSASKSGRPTVHVVRAGETLTRIANEHGVTLEALVAVNGANTVTNGLRPGQELKLPDKSPQPETSLPDNAARALSLIEGRPYATPADAASGSTAVKGSRVASDSGKVYVVGKGETPAMIAQKLKVSYDTLLRLNQIDDPKKLKPGQRLRIPSTAAKPHGKQE